MLRGALFRHKRIINGSATMTGEPALGLMVALHVR
jgi:hypothetical protein